MLTRRGAISVVAIAVAMVAGCRNPGIVGRHQLERACGSDAFRRAIEPGIALGQNIHDHVRDVYSGRSSRRTGPSPAILCQHLTASALAFAGDGRGFDVDAASFRAKQVVTVVPDESDNADGLVEGSKRNLGGITESFDARLALVNGRIDAADRAQTAMARRIKHGEVAVKTGGLIIDDPVRLGPHRVFVRLRTARSGGPRNELIAGSPSIDWNIAVTIDTSGPKPTYEVAGRWDGYPAAELYINREPVLLLTPGAGPGSPVELLKLLPGIGDYKFVRTGTLPSPSGDIRKNQS